MDHGGGVVFGPDEIGRYTLQYTEGFGLPEPVRSHPRLGSKRTVIMYEVSWEATESFIKAFGRSMFENADSIGDLHGMTGAEFLKRWESGDAHDQAMTFVDVAAYYGWHELANEEYVDGGDLAQRWGVKLYEKLPPKVGTRVHVNSDHDEGGRIADDGTIVGHDDGGVLVDVPRISADVFVPEGEYVVRE